MRKGIAAALRAGPLLLAAAEPLAAANRLPSIDSIDWRIDHAEAREIIEAHGFYGVRDLVQDRAGTWRASAVRYGETKIVEVTQKGFFDIFNIEGTPRQ